jgi:hypothetical protein
MNSLTTAPSISCYRVRDKSLYIHEVVTYSWTCAFVWKCLSTAAVDASDVVRFMLVDAGCDEHVGMGTLKLS